MHHLETEQMELTVWDAGLFNVTEHTVHAARADLCYEAEPDQMMIRTEGLHLLVLCAFSHPSQLPNFEHKTQHEAELSPKNTDNSFCFMHVLKCALLYSCPFIAILHLFGRFISNEWNWSQISGKREIYGVKLCCKKYPIKKIYCLLKPIKWFNIQGQGKGWGDFSTYHLISPLCSENVKYFFFILRY